MIHSAEPLFNTDGKHVGEIECEHSYYVVLYDDNGDVVEDAGPYSHRDLADQFISGKGLLSKPEEVINFSADAIGAA